MCYSVAFGWRFTAVLPWQDAHDYHNFAISLWFIVQPFVNEMGWTSLCVLAGGVAEERGDHRPGRRQELLHHHRPQPDHQTGPSVRHRQLHLRRPRTSWPNAAARRPPSSSTVSLGHFTNQCVYLSTWFSVQFDLRQSVCSLLIGESRLQCFIKKMWVLFDFNSLTQSLSGL